MKRINKIRAIILSCAHLLTGVHSAANKLWPKIINNDCTEKKACYDFFWSPNYKNTEVSSQWMIKMIFDDLLYVVIIYTVAKIILEESVKFYLILMTWMLYHIADMFLFMWDYKATEYQYPVILYATVFASFILLVRYREKMHSV